jgi:hypothetical protein
LFGAGARPLYRGMDEQHWDIKALDVRRDRAPKKMPKAIHDAADVWFCDQFGVRYRSAGLFCTGDRDQAAQHGYVHKVFPIGGLQFCWSPKVRDLYEWAKLERLLHRSPQEFLAALESLGYREEDFVQATASGCEVMVACRRYYAVIDHGH